MVYVLVVKTSSKKHEPLLFLLNNVCLGVFQQSETLFHKLL